MKLVSLDMGTILNADSDLGMTLGTDLFVSQMPAAPDRCAAVFDTGGFDEEFDYSYERPTFQVRVRGPKGGFQAAGELAREIRDFLSPRTAFTVGATRYVAIWAMGDVNFIGYDDNGRPLLTMNFRAHRTE